MNKKHKVFTSAKSPKWASFFYKHGYDFVSFMILYRVKRIKANGNIQINIGLKPQ